MSNDSVRFNRSELYELVWSRPVQQLAIEFGLSDVGLAKICKRLDVPRPGRGYWQKLAIGLKPPRTPLPDRPPDSTVLTRTSAAVGPNIPPRIRPEPPIVVLDPDGPRHVVARELRKFNADKPVGDPPMLRVVGEQRRPTLAATPTLRARALQAFDATFRALEQRGHEVRLARSDPSARFDSWIKAVALVRGESIEIAVAETVRQSRRELSAPAHAREVDAHKHHRGAPKIPSARRIER